MEKKTNARRKKAVALSKKRTRGLKTTKKVASRLKRKAFKKTSSRASVPMSVVSVGSAKAMRKALGISEKTVKAVDAAISR